MTNVSLRYTPVAPARKAYTASQPTDKKGLGHSQCDYKAHNGLSKPVQFMLEQMKVKRGPEEGWNWFCGSGSFDLSPSLEHGFVLTTPMVLGVGADKKVGCVLGVRAMRGESDE